MICYFESMSASLDTFNAILCRSCGLKPEDVEPDASLVQDLGVDSIDMMDLLYGLEREYKIHFALGEFEARARKEAAPAVFEVEQVLTPEGLATLRRMLPEVPERLYPAGMIVQQIPLLFTPRVLARLVDEKVAEHQRRQD